MYNSDMTHVKYKLFISTIALCLIAPSVSFAYVSTEQTAARISATEALYTISFRLGFSNRDVYVPIQALRDQTTSDNALHYTILEDARHTTTTGLTRAAVISTASVQDGWYVVPRGSSATFTVLATLTTDPSAAEADYALKVTHLPFTTIVDGLHIRNALTESELRGYLTPEIELNESDAVLLKHHQTSSGLSISATQ